MAIPQEIGRKIHIFRRARNLTLEALAAKICKSKSTVSKYEKGEIAVDIETLYDIAQALSVHIEQLLCPMEMAVSSEEIENCPAFFSGLTHFYGYLFDGRAKQPMRCVFDILGPYGDHGAKIAMYMNFKDYDHYERCENTYWGTIEHFDALTHITLTNQDTPMEKASLQVLASYLNSPTKWGLFNGFSSRPMMPIAIKMLLSKQPLKENEELLNALRVSKEDIRLLKLYNMFSVT